MAIFPLNPNALLRAGAAQRLTAPGKSVSRFEVAVAACQLHPNPAAFPICNPAIAIIPQTIWQAKVFRRPIPMSWMAL